MLTLLTHFLSLLPFSIYPENIRENQRFCGVFRGYRERLEAWNGLRYLLILRKIENMYFSSAPHQPRLDWQMWFAALGSYQHNPWFITLIYKLLHGEQDVLKLMGKNPFPEAPPKFIRSKLYSYHYTKISRSVNGIVDAVNKTR